MGQKPSYEALEEKVWRLEKQIERLAKEPAAVLRDREESYRSFVDNAAIGIYRANSKGRILMVNKKAAQMFGHASPEEAMARARNINEIYSHPALRSAFLQEIADQGYVRRKELKLVKSSGEPIWVEIQARTVTSENGDIVYEGFIQDITERRLAEDALRLAEFLVDQAPVGIFRAGEDARIIYANEYAGVYLGYSRDELSRMTIMDLDPKTTAQVWGALWQKMKNQGRNMLESVHRRKDGSTVPVEITASYIEFQGRAYAVSFVQEISERKQSERLKAQLLQSQKMDAIGQLAGGIAHDFNNILGVIMGYAQLAQLNSRDHSAALRHIAQISLASERARELVQQILTFSRQAKSEKIPVDPGVILKEALKMIRPILPATIEIRHHIEPNLGAIMADQTQIHQVIMNLCTNAYHAMRGQGGLLHIELDAMELAASIDAAFHALPPGKYIRLTVADTGHGMTADVLAHIFEPYFTTKRAGEGCGIGLSTVHGIVKEHGGEIFVYSEPGKGTTFQILFPPADAGAKHTTLRPESLPRGNETILLVDDDQALVDIGRQLLESLGYTVEGWTSAEDAIAAFRGGPERFQLIITDMTMPEVTGDRLARMIHQIRPTIPIILCTGFSYSLTTGALDKSHFKTIVMKPLTLEELAGAVRKALDSP
jgi:PAS domain S-box-containing protein